MWSPCVTPRWRRRAVLATVALLSFWAPCCWPTSGLILWLTNWDPWANHRRWSAQSMCSQEEWLSVPSSSSSVSGWIFVFIISSWQLILLVHFWLNKSVSHGPKLTRGAMWCCFGLLGCSVTPSDYHISFYNLYIITYNSYVDTYYRNFQAIKRT